MLMGRAEKKLLICVMCSLQGTSFSANADCDIGDADSFRNWATGMGTGASSCPDLRSEVGDKIGRVRKALSAATASPNREKCLRAFDEGLAAGRREKDKDSCASVKAQRAAIEKEIIRLNEEAARLAAESKAKK